MAEERKSTDSVRAPSSANGTAFRDMTQPQKIRWSMKLAVCIMSFGFIFPNVMTD